MNYPVLTFLRSQSQPLVCLGCDELVRLLLLCATEANPDSLEAYKGKYLTMFQGLKGADCTVFVVGSSCLFLQLLCLTLCISSA
jgi:hypothetical protein